MCIKRGYILYLGILFIMSCLISDLTGQRCEIKHDNKDVKISSVQLKERSKYSFQLVFHVLYSSVNENIHTNQIYSQLEILNKYFNKEVSLEDNNIPEEFRHLKANPAIFFCLAELDPNGAKTDGVTRHVINDISIACKKEFGKISIMHKTLGGVDIWDPNRYINIYVVNRDQCPALGEAIFPWNSTTEQDGIIIDYRALGNIGPAAENIPYHQGKTLVHELGHYFGLKHLSNDQNNCFGDDLVADTPPQALEYFNCPKFPQRSCGNNDMTMNFMSLVNDPCMSLFTKDQVYRMHLIIEEYKKGLINNACDKKTLQTIEKIQWVYQQNSWQINHPEKLPWSGHIYLFNVSGQLVWQDIATHTISFSIPHIKLNLSAGVYFLRIEHEHHNKLFKLLKYP